MSYQKILWVVPDLPSANEILPFLETIDNNRWYSNFGPLEKQFREELAQTFFPDLPPDNLTTASSGALAIEIALIAHGFPPGARILIPSYTFVATAAAVIRAGYVPIFADVEVESLQMPPESAARLARSHGCAAVVPVGPAGMEIPTAPWDAFVEDSGIPVILDAAASLGNQPVGNHLTVAFSLHATKPLGIGEGGLVVSRNTNLISRARTTANFGLEGGRGVLSGTNAKLSEYHAAVGLAQIQRRQSILHRRMDVLRLFESQAASFQDEFRLLTPSRKSPANLLVLFKENRAKATRERLAAAGFESRRLYIPPVHRHPAYLGFPCAEPLHQCEVLASRSLSLPCHFLMTPDDVQRMMQALVKSPLS